MKDAPVDPTAEHAIWLAENATWIRQLANKTLAQSMASQALAFVERLPISKQSEAMCAVFDAAVLTARALVSEERSQS